MLVCLLLVLLCLPLSPFCHLSALWPIIFVCFVCLGLVPDNFHSVSCSAFLNSLPLELKPLFNRYCVYCETWGLSVPLNETANDVHVFLSLQPRAIPRVWTAFVRAPTCVSVRASMEGLLVMRTLQVGRSVCLSPVRLAGRLPIVVFFFCQSLRLSHHDRLSSVRGQLFLRFHSVIFCCFFR